MGSNVLGQISQGTQTWRAKRTAAFNPFLTLTSRTWPKWLASFISIFIKITWWISAQPILYILWLCSFLYKSHWLILSETKGSIIGPWRTPSTTSQSLSYNCVLLPPPSLLVRSARPSPSPPLQCICSALSHFLLYIQYSNWTIYMSTAPQGLRLKTAYLHQALLYRTIPCRRRRITPLRSCTSTNTPYVSKFSSCLHPVHHCRRTHLFRSDPNLEFLKI
jgi:hypothetical protein